jgi:hypothetical protein
MLQLYGYAPTILVPDNPRAGVTKADRYEPELQRSYEEISLSVKAEARRLVDLLPYWISAPDAVPDPDGEIALSWPIM